MVVKIKNSGLYISKLNGKQLVNNQYALDIDSSRQKKKQVLGMFKNNGVVETMHDSFQNYMNKTSSKNQSIFDLLKNERNEISKLPNIVMKIADTSPIMPITPMPITPTPTSSLKKMIMKQKTRKLANSNNGISSKLFDFTNIEQAPNPNPNPYPKSKLKSTLKNIYQTRKRQRKRSSRRNRKRL